MQVKTPGQSVSSSGVMWKVRVKAVNDINKVFWCRVCVYVYVYVYVLLKGPAMDAAVCVAVHDCGSKKSLFS